MAKVNIIRWDGANLLPKLLDVNDTGMINILDVTGSSGDLKIGPADASSVVLGKTGGALILSGALTSSVGGKISGTIDLPGQQSFKLDGVAVSSNNFTAANLSILFNGSNADALHVHAGGTQLTASLQLVNSINVNDFMVAGAAGAAVSGTQVVYLNQASIEPANAATVAASRVIGIVSGSAAGVRVASGSIARVLTTFGDICSNFAGLTPGAVYYLDLATTGSITTSPPTGNGSSIVEVGVAKSTTQLIFRPSLVARNPG